MNYIPQILFSIGAVGFINCLILSIYFLLGKSYAKISNRLFGLFLLVLSLRVLNSIFYAFSTPNSAWYINIGPAFFLLIGPLLFSYTVFSLKPNSFWAECCKKHLLFWCSVSLALMMFLPHSDNIHRYKSIVLPLINGQWLIYIALAAYSTFHYKRTQKNKTQYKWFVSFIGINLIIWASFAFIDFEYFISGAIIFSIIFNGVFVFFLLNKKISDKIFVKTKTNKSAKNADASMGLLKVLNKRILSEKLHLNSNLKMADFADVLEISPHELSRILNENLGKSFTDFINEYRIKEVKRLIATHDNYTLEAIGNMSGFNSKSAFYKAFKKMTGTTPARYKSSN